jgi:hypothetical protein
MRAIYTILPALAATLLVGCAHDRGQSISWNGHTILPNDQSIGYLNDVAGNPTGSRDERAKAVFSLFAHYIRPGFAAGEVRRVLTDTNWMGDVNLYGVSALGGWVPLESSLDDTKFCLHLFPVEQDKRWSPWVIYFRLSGHPRSDVDALAFLHGANTIEGDPKLLEFALCFPSASEGHMGRIERFGRGGIHVYQQQ